MIGHAVVEVLVRLTENDLLVHLTHNWLLGAQRSILLVQL